LNLDYSIVFSLASYLNSNVVIIIGVCLLIGAMAKSSQVGQGEALKNLWCDSGFLCTLQNAGKISNALESTSSNSVLNNITYYTDKLIDLEKFQRQGINQQDLIKLNNYTDRKSDIGVLNLQLIELQLWRERRLKELNQDFLTWFIGYSEGIGCFLVEKGRSCFVIHTHFTDLPTLIEIKTQLNIGTININKKNVEFKVSDPREIGLLIEIFNGKIYFKSVQTAWEGWCKNYFHKTQVTIELIPHTFKPSLSDSWLAGLFDASGSVKLDVLSRSKDLDVSINQCLSIYHKEDKVEFEYLSKLVNGKFLKKERNRYIVTVDYKDINSLVNYFSMFKLYTVKAESMIKWLDIHNYRVSNPNIYPKTKGYSLVKRNAAFIKFSSKLINNRYYSQLSRVSSSTLDKDFIEWFRGLVDGEGCFDFRRKKGTKNFEFNFRIVLHIDDVALLQFILNLMLVQ